MPRMISRNHMLYRRRSSLTAGTNSAKSSSSSIGDSDSPLDQAFRWFFISKPNSAATSAEMSLQSSARSSPSRSPVFGRSQTCDQLYHAAAALGNCNPSREGEEDTWGQFVDTAEAEKEVIRHSKILSKRYSIQ